MEEQVPNFGVAIPRGCGNRRVLDFARPFSLVGWIFGIHIGLNLGRPSTKLQSSRMCVCSFRSRHFHHVVCLFYVGYLAVLTSELRLLVAIFDKIF